MATYLTQFSYTPEAWAALAKNPEDRGKAFASLAEKLGGKMHNIYYTFGEYDGLVIADFPDDTTAMAGIVAATTPGHLKATETTKLFSMEEALGAMRKAKEMAYPAPKG
jgi:uncharacterized protein with GYD domain